MNDELKTMEVIPGTKPRRRRKKAFDKLTVNNQLFVNEILTGTPGATAITKLGMASTPDKAAKKAYDLINTPKVALALNEKMNEMYPNLAEQVSKKIKYLMDLPIKFDAFEKGPGLTPGQFLKYVEYLSKLHGWEAAKKSAHLRAVVTQHGFKFPGEKE